MMNCVANDYELAQRPLLDNARLQVRLVSTTSLPPPHGGPAGVEPRRNTKVVLPNL